MALKKKKKKT